MSPVRVQPGRRLGAHQIDLYQDCLYSSATIYSKTEYGSAILRRRIQRLKKAIIIEVLGASTYEIFVVADDFLLHFTGHTNIFLYTHNNIHDNISNLSQCISLQASPSDL